MPRRFLNRDDDLQLDLRQGASSAERLTWMRRAQRQQRLPKPLNQLGARGVWVPPPPANSQGAIVKLWLAKASTTGVHTSYLRQGKGIDGMDAELFDRDGPVDRHAFVQHARQDSHQIRGMVSLDAGDRADLRRFLPRLMAQFEADIGARVDWLGAIHHDTPRVHAHVVIRGVLADGQKLYLTRSYWAHGLKYRAQGLATAMLGPVRRPMSTQLSVTLGRLRERLHGKELTHG
jgi:hypothetical protein